MARERAEPCGSWLCRFAVWQFVCLSVVVSALTVKEGCMNHKAATGRVACVATGYAFIARWRHNTPAPRIEGADAELTPVISAL